MGMRRSMLYCKNKKNCIKKEQTILVCLIFSSFKVESLVFNHVNSTNNFQELPNSMFFNKLTPNFPKKSMIQTQWYFCRYDQELTFLIMQKLSPQTNIKNYTKYSRRIIQTQKLSINIKYFQKKVNFLIDVSTSDKYNFFISFCSIMVHHIILFILQKLFSYLSLQKFNIYIYIWIFLYYHLYIRKLAYSIFKFLTLLQFQNLNLMLPTPMQYTCPSNSGKHLSKVLQEISPHEQLPSSSKTINEEQKSVELMIRAHERIRSLQQDNQILREHVELLTKDNKDILDKLTRLQNEKTQQQKYHQELRMKIKQLEIKLGREKVKKQLELLQKQNNCRAQYQNKWRDSPKIVNNQKYCYNESVSNKKTMNQIIGLNATREVQKSENQIVMESSQPVKIGQKFISPIKNQQIINPGHKSLQKHGNISKNEPYIEFQNHSSHFSHISHSLDQTQQYFFNKSASKYEALHNSYNYYNTLHNNSKTLSQHPQDSPISKYKDLPLTDNHRYINTEQRPKSPLIRKNSYKNAKPSCEFHIKNSRTNVGIGENTSQSRLGKKFNYTNWRRSNNNQLVWKLGNSSSKPIVLNR